MTTGVNLAWKRVYDPEIGRWISRDPIGYAVGLNLYAYVDNDPVNWLDLLGLEPIELDGTLKLDTDGSGDSWGDPSHQSQTSWQPGGLSLNADTDSYVVAPKELRDQGVRPGDDAEVTIGGGDEAPCDDDDSGTKTISSKVGDFGPDNKGVGEVSIKAAQDLGVGIKRTKYGPVPTLNGSTKDIPVKVKYYPSGTPKTPKPGKSN